MNVMPDDSSCTIFYAWQSQLPNATNRAFIKDAIERAAKAVRDDVTIEARPEIDHDTLGVPGSPNIADTIRAKIDAAAAVVCDVSIVQGLDGDGERIRAVPNPNVLIELGYAMKSLGTMDRLVMVMNTSYGGVEHLPFDLRQYRPTMYELPEGTSDKANVRQKLVAALEATFRKVLLIPKQRPHPKDTEISLTYEDNSEGKGSFIATIKNVGRTVLDSWVIELLAPRPLVLAVSNRSFGAYQERDSNSTESRFSTSPNFGKHYPLKPGVTHEFKVPYVVSEDSAALLDKHIVARGYLDGRIDDEASRPLSELTSFFSSSRVALREAQREHAEAIKNARG